MSVHINNATSGKGEETHGHFMNYKTQAGLYIRLLRRDERKPRVYGEYNNDWYDLIVVVEDNQFTQQATNISLVYHPKSFRNGEIYPFLRRLRYVFGEANVRQSRDTYHPDKLRVTVRLWCNRLTVERKIGDFLENVDIMLPLTRRIREHRDRCGRPTDDGGRGLAA